MLKKIFFCQKLLLVVVIMFSVVSCQSNRNTRIRETPKLPCKVLGASDQQIMTMQEDFEKQGIRVVTIGQNFMVAIPAHMLFAEQSPRILWGAHGTLNDVACFLKQFRIVELHITSYSSSCVSRHRERALTITRSRGVMDYLKSQGVDARIFLAHGLGTDKPKTWYKEGGDSSPNARVEITFRRQIK